MYNLTYMINAIFVHLPLCIFALILFLWYIYYIILLAHKNSM